MKVTLKPMPQTKTELAAFEKLKGMFKPKKKPVPKPSGRPPEKHVMNLEPRKNNSEYRADKKVVDFHKTKPFKKAGV